MIEIKGKVTTAKVFTDDVEINASEQIYELCSQEFTQDSTIRIMPDVHAGAGCVIGTTMTLHGRVVPNLVGVDIGCGVSVTKLKITELDCERLDQAIRNCIPSGFSTRTTPHPYLRSTGLWADILDLNCSPKINQWRAELSIGTLGGGNHFIEVDRDDAGGYYLVVHTGSRNLGKQVAEHYQAMAVEYHESKRNKRKAEVIKHFRRENRETEISAALKAMNPTMIPPALCYLEGDGFDQYLHDMEIAQRYAQVNRDAIVDEIKKAMGWEEESRFTTVHNYIEIGPRILRKGAVSAYENETLLIPLNMRDGSLICRGKGNPDWNFSAPHGAGRTMGRGVAKRTLLMADFKTAMNGIFSTCVTQATLDEAPGAYKPVEAITSNIADTVDVIQTIKPCYNFKAVE